MTIAIKPADTGHAREIALMTEELLAEITGRIGRPAFRFDLADAQQRLQAYLADGIYRAFIAIDEMNAGQGRVQAAGFIAVYESHAIYAGGAFGTIPEFYVRPEYRQRGTGRRLLAAVRNLGMQQGWTRLEVTTPPLPEFQAVLAYYEKEGFAVTGGRKLQQEL